MFLTPPSRLRFAVQSFRSSRSDGLLSFNSLTTAALVLCFLVLTPIGLAAKGDASAKPKGPFEVVALRTAHSKTFVDEKGEFHTRVYSARINYKTAGVWRPVDNKLVESGRKGFAFKNAANSYKVHFKDRLEDDFMRLETPGGRAAVEVSLEKADDVDAVKSSAREISYRAARDDADILYDVTAEGVKETVVLKDADAPSSYAFKIEPDEGDDLDAVAQKDGSIRFVAEDGRATLFTISAPSVADSAGAKGGIGSSAPGKASMKIKEEDGAFRLEVSIDKEWFEDPARVFPVYLDPNYNIYSSNDAYYVTKANGTPCSGCTPDTSQVSNKVGYELQGGGGGPVTEYVFKKVASFDLSSIPLGAQVTSVATSLYLDDCLYPTACQAGMHTGTVRMRRLTSAWQPSQPWGQVTSDSTLLASTYLNPGPDTPYPTWDPVDHRYWLSLNGDNLRSLVNYLVNHPAENYGFLYEKTVETTNGFRFASLRKGAGYGPLLELSWYPTNVVLDNPRSLHANGAELTWQAWGGAYPSEIAADAPAAYYRLNESSGSIAYDSSENEETGSYGPVTFGQTGAVPGDDKATAYNGTSSWMLTSSLTDRMDDASETLEVWFKANAAGVVVTELGQPQGNAAWHDTAIEVLSSGEVKARVWNLTPITLGTASFGAWHHAVLRYKDSTDTLDGFLDGVLAGGTTGVRQVPWMSGYNQYYALGVIDSTHMGSGAWFNGSIDEFSVYPQALPNERISAHYNAGKFRQYKVHRSATSGFTPGSSTLVGTIGDAGLTTFRDTTARANATFYYKLVAEAFNGSYTTNQVGAALPAENPTSDPGGVVRAPQVAISNPKPNSLVKGNVQLRAEAFDDGKIYTVQFKLDGATVGNIEYYWPYEISWDTTGVSRGEHTLTAIATDDAGNVTTSSSVAVFVVNSNVPTVSATITDTGSSGNLIANDSFESSLSGWSAWHATLSRSSAVSKAGSWSAMVTADQSGGSSISTGVQLTGSTAARTFVVSAWVYVPAESSLLGEGVIVLARAVGGSGPGMEESSSSYVFREGWQQINASRTLEQDDRTQIQLHVYTEGQSGSSFYIDSANLHELRDASISASASDDFGVDHVDFMIDGKRFASDLLAPWAANLDTLAFPVFDGAHQITARAFDADGNAATSAPQQLTVANGEGTRFRGIVSAAGVPREFSSEPGAGSTSGGPHGTSVLDDFNRQDGGLGSDWSPMLEGEPLPNIANNEVVGAAGQWKSGRWLPDTPGRDQEVWTHVDNTDVGQTWLWARATDEENGCVALLQTEGQDRGVRLGTRTNGTFTWGNWIYDQGDVDGFALTAVGDQISAWVLDGDEWIQRATMSDTTHQGGSVGFELLNAVELDDFGGGGVEEGLPQPASVELENTSEQLWTASRVKLRYRWLNTDGSVFSTSESFDLGEDISPGGSTSVPIVIQPPELPASVMRGRFTLRIDLYDAVNETYFAAQGNEPFEQQVTATRVQPDELGLERYQQYDGTDLGSNFGASVNLANGNLVVESTLSRQPGVGLDTVAELNYNSLEQGSVSPVGNNWSLAISGLTPFGLPLDIHPNAADTAAGRSEHWIGLTDGDGTYHCFTLNAGGHFYDAPAGVHLYVRETTNPTGYAFTKPDRTTFYFDADGYPTRVEDKNGNQITYTLASIPAGSDINGLSKKITAVTDEKGRSYDVGYFDPSNTTRPGLWGKVSYIEDHLDHKFVFAYYDDGNLLSVTEQGGQNADGSYLVDRSVVFNYTNDDGSGPAIATLNGRRNPDPSTTQSTRLYSVIDARGSETSFSYASGEQQWRVNKVTNRAGDDSSTYSYEIGAGSTETSVLQAEGEEGQARDWEYTLDGAGKLTSFVDPLEHETTVEWWTGENNVKKVTEPTGKYVEYEYNSNGYMTETTEGLGENTRTATTTFQNLQVDAYDTAHPHISRITSTTKPQGNATPAEGDYTWSFDYTNDTTDDVLYIRDPGVVTGDSESMKTKNMYKADGSGLFASQTKPSTGDGITRTTTYDTYDSNGLPTQVTDAAGKIAKAGYDDAGNLLWQQDPNHQSFSGGDPTQYRSYYYYDTYGRVGRTSSPKSSTIFPGLLIWDQTAYDANDNVLKDWNPQYGVGDNLNRQSYPTAVLADNPISYWRLGEAGGSIAEDEKGANNGSYINGPTLGAPGALAEDVDTGVTLNGSDEYADAGNPASLQIGTGTVEVWIKTSNAGTSHRGLVVKQFAYGLFLNNNILVTHHWPTQTDISTGINLADGRWHHVAMSFQNGVSNGSTIFVDGQARLTFTYAIAHQGGTFNVGSGGNVAGGLVQQFAGSLDDAAVYPLALSEAQIYEHFDTGRGARPHTGTQYDSLDRPTLVTSPRGSRTQSFYDPAGRLTRVVKPNGFGQSEGYSETVTSYDALDRVYQTTDYAQGLDSRTTTSCYDLAGDLRLTIKPKGSTIGMNCPAVAAPSSYVFPENQYSARMYYDFAHRQVSTSTTNGSIWRSTETTYDANGQVTSVTDQNDKTTTTTYNDRGLPIRTVEPFDSAPNPDRMITTVKEYDTLGRVTRLISPRAYDTGGAEGPWNDYVTSYSYDPLDRLVRTTLPDGPSTAYRVSALSDRPFAYWRLGETSGTTATDQIVRSDGHTNGTYTGGYTQGQTGAIAASGDADQAALLNGSDGHVRVPLMESFGGDDFSVEAWAKRSSTGTDDYIISQGTPQSNQGLLFGFLASGSFICGFYGNDLVTTQTYNDTDWHHWACTYNEHYGNRAIYRDGVVVATDSGRPYYWGAGELHIGGVPWGGSVWRFNGTIDEVAIYKRELPEHRVKAHYNAGIQAKVLKYTHQVYDANGNQTMISLPTKASTPQAINPRDKTTTTYLDTGSIYGTLDGSSALFTRYDYTAEGWQSVRWPEFADAIGTIDYAKAMYWDFLPDGLVSSIRDEGGLRERNTYDANGNQTASIAGSGANEYAVNRIFDGFGEETQVRVPDLQYASWFLETNYQYDWHGNVVSKEVNRQENSYETLINDGRIFTYDYNALDQVTAQTDDFYTPASNSDDERLTYSYTPTGQLSSRALAKVNPASTEQEAVFEYFDNGLLRQQTNYRGAQGGDIVERHQLSYIDDGVYMNGNKVSDTFMLNGPDAGARCYGSNCTATWEYDAQDRLVVEGPGTESYPALHGFDMDTIGNVIWDGETKSTYLGQRLDTQKGPDGYTFRLIYDGRGNLACKVWTPTWDQTVCPTVPENLLESYTYDYKNRLTAYARYGLQSQLIDQTAYTLDSLDRTISKTETHVEDGGMGDSHTTTTQSVYEGDSTTVTKEILTGWGPTEKTYAQDAFGNSITFSDHPGGMGVSRYSYLHDPGSSVSLVLDSTGQAKESYGYSAYGSPNSAISKTASGFSDYNAPTNQIRFQGKRFDSGSGSYDMGARRYSASAGRWFQQDMYYKALQDLGLSQDPLTANKYSFLSANPVNYVEDDGHKAAKRKYPKPKYKKPNSNEDPENAKYCVSNPHKAGECYVAMKTGMEDRNTASSLFPNDERRCNAFRHCIWSADLHVLLGTKSAKGFLGRHEMQRGSAADHEMDLRNNRIGMAVAAVVLYELGNEASYADRLKKIPLAGGLLKRYVLGSKEIRDAIREKCYYLAKHGKLVEKL